MANDQVGQKCGEIRRKIGALVRRLRAERDWSQEDLVDEARLHTNHVGCVEHGQKMPMVGALRRIAQASSQSERMLLLRAVPGYNTMTSTSLWQSSLACGQPENQD